MEDIDNNPDCPVTSGVVCEDGGSMRPGRSSPCLLQSVRASGSGSASSVWSQPVRAVVPVASGSGSGTSVRARGNQCWDVEDVWLLALATSHYWSLLVTSYAPITVGRVVSLLRAEGGPYADLVDRFEAREGGRRCLADCVRLMVQSERRRQGLLPPLPHSPSLLHGQLERRAAVAA